MPPLNPKRKHDDLDEDPRSFSFLGKLERFLERCLSFIPGFLRPADQKESLSLPLSASKNSRRLWFAIALFMFLMAAAGGAVVYWAEESHLFIVSRSHLEPILNWQPSDNTLIFDKDGEKIGEVFSSYHIFKPYDQIPEDLIRSVLAIEDRHFFNHPGIDIQAMIRAFVVWIKNQDGASYKQGASTITQQVVRHFLLTKEKTITRKLREIVLALELEKLLSKEKILEIYLNAMFLGQGAYGVGAAAKRYFNKDLSALELHEHALIAGLFQSPSRYNPHRYPEEAKKRQQKVLYALVQNDDISRSEAASWNEKKLTYEPYQPIFGTKAPYFVDYVKDEAQKILNQKKISNKGLRIHTTLDFSLQLAAEEALAQQEKAFEKMARSAPPYTSQDGASYHPKIEAAMVVNHPLTGHVLAMIGGRSYDSSRFNRAVQAMRQPGSSFKPVVFSLALASGYKWSDMIFVSPIMLAGHYRPKSPTADYLTETTLLRAFYRSMNAPTMEVGEKLGIDKIIEQAKKLGIASPIKKEFGSILGSSEVTLLDMAQMYSVFAAQGMKTPLVAITKITDAAGEVLYENTGKDHPPERVLGEETAYLMLQGLRSVLQRGTAHQAAALSSFAAGKTGTSNDSKDNWFCGFSRDLVASVWVGTDEFTSLPAQAQGSTLALPIWQQFMEKVQSFRPARSFPPPPPSLVSMKIHSEYGYQDEEGIIMWFVDSNQPSPDSKKAGDLSKAATFRNPFSR